jgi:hypothetical protein
MGEFQYRVHLSLYHVWNMDFGHLLQFLSPYNLPKVVQRTGTVKIYISDWSNIQYARTSRRTQTTHSS